MVLTEEQKTDKYPTATLETAKLNTVEKNYYAVQDAQVVNKSEATGITDYINDNGIGNNPSDPTFETTNSAKLYKLNSGTVKTGLGITLKVMAGDKIDVFGKSYYFQNTGGTGGNSPVPVLDILNGFLNSPASVGPVHGIGGSDINVPAGVTGINSMITQQGNQSNAAPTKPRAFINVIFFDEQFKSYEDGFSISMVGANSVVKDHFSELQNLIANKSGYVYIYCSNESPVNVFFDNMQVVHTRGAVLEETHYYPFGLTMAGISSKSANTTHNKLGITSKEIQAKEFSDGSGLEWYDFGARFQDAQIGRWHTGDPLSSNYYWLSPFNYCNNNPIKYFDPNGMEFKDSVINGKNQVIDSKTMDVITVRGRKRANNSLANLAFPWANEAAKPKVKTFMSRKDTYLQARSKGWSQNEMHESWVNFGVSEKDLESFERHYQAEIYYRNISIVSVSAMAAPIAITELGVGSGLVSLYSQASSAIGVATLRASILTNISKNLLVRTISNEALLYSSSPLIYQLSNLGYTSTITGKDLGVIMSKVLSFTQKNYPKGIKIY